jgi:hypothetical protein
MSTVVEKAEGKNDRNVKIGHDEQNFWMRRPANMDISGGRKIEEYIYYAPKTLTKCS